MGNVQCVYELKNLFFLPCLYLIIYLHIWATLNWHRLVNTELSHTKDLTPAGI